MRSPVRIGIILYLNARKRNGSSANIAQDLAVYKLFMFALDRRAVIRHHLKRRFL